MSTRSRGKGTNIDWLRMSCDISPCDFGSERNQEKYGRPVKSARVSNDSWGGKIYLSLARARALTLSLSANILCKQFGGSHIRTAILSGLV